MHNKAHCYWYWALLCSLGMVLYKWCAPPTVYSHSNTSLPLGKIDSEVQRVPTAASDVGSMTLGQGFLDHQVFPIGAAFVGILPFVYISLFCRWHPHWGYHLSRLIPGFTSLPSGLEKATWTLYS